MQILRQKYREREFLLPQFALQQIRGELIYQRQVRQRGELRLLVQARRQEHDRVQRHMLVLQELQIDLLHR